MDIDVKIVSSLPPDIKAANDFLMGYGQHGSMVFTNAVMAAPSNSLFVKKLIKDIEYNFQLVGKKNILGKSDRQVQKARLGLALTQELSREDPIIIAYENTRNYNLLNGTFAITGPVAVQLAIYRNICWLKGIKERSPMELYPKDFPWSIANFAGVAKIFMRTVATPAINGSGLKDQYKFPMAYIEIGSANSWVV